MKNTLKNTAIRLGRNAKKTVRSLGLAGLLTASALSIFSPRNAYADSADEDQKQDPIGEVIREATLKTDKSEVGKPTASSYKIQPQEEEIKKATVEETRDVISRINDKYGFTPKPNEIVVEKTEFDNGIPSYFVTFRNLDDKEAYSRLQSVKASTDKDSAIYYPQALEEDLEGLWQVINYDLEKDILDIKKKPSLEQYARLVKKQFAKEKRSKEEFFRFNKDVKNEDGYLKGILVNHERAHQLFWNSDPIEEKEKLAYAFTLACEENEELELGLVVRSEDDSKFPSSESMRIANDACMDIKRFYDKKMQELGITSGQYTALSKEQIRNIAKKYLQENFPYTLEKIKEK